MTKSPGMRGRPAGKARYRVIAQDIVRRIMKGEWAPGTCIPPSRELKAAYGVSITTLLHALKEAKQQGYLRFGPGQRPVAALGAPLSDFLGKAVVVVVSTGMAIFQSDPHWKGAICNAILSGTRDTGWPILILQGRNSLNPPSALFNIPLQGVLLVACPFKTELLKQYEAFKCPVVMIDRPPDGLEFHSISAANHQMSFDATSRLIALGHRRIGFLRSVMMRPGTSIAMDPDVSERMAGFEAACKGAGFESHQYRVITEYTHAAGLNELFRATPPFTAIVTSDAGMAESAARQAAAAKLKVPRDLSIVTVLTTERYGRNWSGPRIDFGEFGRKAVELLLSKPQSLQHIRIPAVWNEGETLQEPPTHAPARKLQR